MYLIRIFLLWYCQNPIWSEISN